MIRLEALEETIQATLFTAHVEGERPGSLLVVADFEMAKSETTVEFGDNEGILCLTDFTAFGLTKRYLPDLMDGRIRHLIIPDLMIPLSKSRETISSTVGFLSALTEEGVREITTYNFQDGLKLPRPVRAGVIAAIATQDFERWRKEWAQAGFLSRFLAFSYSYDSATVDCVFAAILAGIPLANQIQLQFPPRPQHVEMPHDISRALETTARSMGAGLGIHGFRPLKHLIRLAKGRALSCGRTGVTAEDRDWILKMGRYFNFSRNKLT
jgi:hypothetical protein